MDVNRPPFSPASAMPSLIHLRVPARRGRSRGGRCTKRSALSNGRPASSIVASWLNKSALTLNFIGVRVPPGIAIDVSSPMHYQMLTAHRCETGPAVDNPRHLRKTHGPDPDAPRLPSAQ